AITVTAVNDAPVAQDGALTTGEDTAATSSLVATDVDSATLTYSLVDTSTAHGTVTVTNVNTGAYSYSPDLNYNGPASFTFQASRSEERREGKERSTPSTADHEATAAQDRAPTTAGDTAATGQ